MGPLRGAYNKTSDPALTEEQLSELDNNFSTFRKQLTCPACFKTTTFHRNGSSNKEPYQPQFSCTSCNKTAKAFEMYPLVRSAAQTSHSAPALTTATLPDLETTPTTSQSALIQQLCQTVEKLTSELSQARLEIQDLHARLNSMPSSTYQADFPTIQGSQPPTTEFANAPWHNQEKLTSVKQPSSQQREKRRQQKEAAAARFFQPPSENQGFKYLYIPTKARIPVGTLRTTFRKLGVNNARLLDIHYPARNTVAIFIHNDYESEFTELLHRHNIPIKADFNPASGAILADPKYATATSAERDTIASELQRSRIDRALDHIRAPIKFAVAHFFLEQKWITQSKFDSLKVERTTQLTSIFDQTQTHTATQESQLPEDSQNDIDMDTPEDLLPPVTVTTGTPNTPQH